jgi:hypothetical protein
VVTIVVRKSGRSPGMPPEINRDGQLTLLSHQQLAKLKIGPGLSPTRIQEKETASSTSGGVRKAPCSGGGMGQERLPGIDWSK